MILRHIYDDKLAMASYLIGCPAAGEAVVIDPHRDAEVYLDLASSQGLAITQVTETHIHADFVSGLRELSARSGAVPHLSDEGGPDWRYEYAQRDGARLLRDGDTIQVGAVELRALHTPGHTPEHISFLVTDRSVSDRPMGLLSGDFLFVGDVGRPDLLEMAAGISGAMEAGARQLFGSLQRLRELPDYLQIWPGHGAGSACGRSLGAVPQSTLGYERLVNWALGISDEDEFVRAVLADQPEAPRYFAEMKRINKQGPELLGGWRHPPRFAADRLTALLSDDAIVVDTRPAPDYAREHVPGTLNIPLNRAFNTWAGSLLPYDRDLYLIVAVDCAHCADEAVRDLSFIGLDRVAGYFDGRSVAEWTRTAGRAGRLYGIEPEELARLLETEDPLILDVRGEAEWRAGRIPGAPNLPLGSLPDRIDEVPRDRPVVVHCQTGARAAIAASILSSRGFEQVYNLEGGFARWRDEDRPADVPDAATTRAHA